MEHVKNLVVGCGLAGAVIAERIASQKGEEVLIIDQREHIAGNVYDYRDANGINIHKYGPHVFHTKNKEVWGYLSQFTEWHYFMYRVKAVIDGIETIIPFNLNSIQQVFPPSLAKRLEKKLLAIFPYNKKIPILELRKQDDPDLQFLANYVYEKVFLGYTIKQWGVTPEEQDPSVSGRVPVFISRDNRYFQDAYQAIPKDGYTKMVGRMLDHPCIAVQLHTRYQEIKGSISYDRLFYTGPIDEFFDYELGELPYRSLHFDFIEYDCSFYQSGPQINYPENYDFTRAVEYKYYLDDLSDKTVVSFEYPEAFKLDKNERYYPIPDKKNQSLYEQYLEKGKKECPNVCFLGRLGEYKYYNMDEVILKILSVIC